METRASYLLVGSFVLLLTGGILGFVIWLGKVEFDQSIAQYDIYFTGNVSGLRIGSSVSYRGVPVGEVIDVGVDPGNVERVLATIEVPADTPIRSDTVASLQLQGITGGLNVLLSGGTQAAPPLVPGLGEERAVISAQASKLEQLFDEAPELVDNVQVLINRASSVLSAQNQAAFAQTLANLDLLTGALADRVGDVQLLINDTAGTMANVRDATAESLDGEQVAQLVAKLEQAVESFDIMVREFHAMAAENREPLLQFSTGTMVEFSNFLAEARGLIAGLNRVTTEVERDPTGFLFGNQQQGYEPSE